MLHRESNIILPETFDLLIILQADEYLKDFFLVGGNTLALRLGHKFSIDIVLFTNSDFDANELNNYLVRDYGLHTKTIQKNTIMGFVKGIKVDFIAHKYRLLYPLFQVDGVSMAELLNIAAMKLNAIGYSGHRYKDFIDIFFLLKLYPLEKMVDTFCEKYPSSNGQGLAKWGNLENVSSNLAQKFNRITNVQLLPSAPILPNPC